MVALDKRESYGWKQCLYRGGSADDALSVPSKPSGTKTVSKDLRLSCHDIDVFVDVVVVVRSSR